MQRIYLQLTSCSTSRSIYINADKIISWESVSSSEPNERHTTFVLEGANKYKNVVKVRETEAEVLSMFLKVKDFSKENPETIVPDRFRLILKD